MCVMCDTGHVCFAQAMLRYDVIGLESTVRVKLRFWVLLSIIVMRSSVRVEYTVDVE